MSESADANGRGVTASRRGWDGLRAAMYGEMAAAAAGERPWCEREAAWDAALAAAIRFLDASTVDQRRARTLLEEAAATRMAGDFYGWDVPVVDVCDRLSAEFRRRVRA